MILLFTMFDFENFVKKTKWYEPMVKWKRFQPNSLHTLFFYKQRFFSTQPQRCLAFSWIELHMLLRCCLLHIGIIIVRHFLYLVYFCPCLDVGLFMLYQFGLFYTFIFIMISSIILWIEACPFACLLKYVLIVLDNVDEECE